MAALVLLAALLLAIPVELTLRLDTAAVRRLRVTLLWLFGLVRIEIGGRNQAPLPPQKPRSQPRPAKTGRGGFGAMIRSRGFLPALLRFVKELFSQVKIGELACRLDFGLDDPADTGRLYGTLMALPLARREAVVLTPHFDGEELHATGVLAARTVPLQVAWVTIRFALSPAVLRALWASRRA